MEAPVAPVVESWCIRFSSDSEARRHALKSGFGDDIQSAYSWEWRELTVPTGPLGYGWYVAEVVSAEKVKVSRETLIGTEEQVIMRSATNNFDRQPHAGMVIATRLDGCVFGFRPGSTPPGEAKFRRLAILHPVPDAPEFMDWAGKAFGQQTTEDAYVFHVVTPQE